MRPEEITLVLLFKRPRPGYGKQRLATTVGKEAAALLAERFLECALEDAAAWSGPVVLAPARANDRSWAETLLDRPAEVIPQGEGNLGERVQALDRLLHQRGQVTLYMGSDAPALQPLHFDAAVHEFADHDVVLARADDGGVVLMGNRRPWPELGALPWSSSSLGDALFACCAEAGYRCVWSVPGYDIDLESDLNRLLSDLEADPRPARRALRSDLQRLMQRQPVPNAKES